MSSETPTDDSNLKRIDISIKGEPHWFVVPEELTVDEGIDIQVKLREFGEKVRNENRTITDREAYRLMLGLIIKDWSLKDKKGEKLPVSPETFGKMNLAAALPFFNWVQESSFLTDLSAFLSLGTKAAQ